eukprot:6061210-Alexandrium_andersonii.AAC.1
MSAPTRSLPATAGPSAIPSHEDAGMAPQAGVRTGRGRAGGSEKRGHGCLEMSTSALHERAHSRRAPAAGF